MQFLFTLRSFRGEVIPYTISRTILIPNDATLEDVHDIMMEVFKWFEPHAYSFHFDGEPFDTTDGEYGSPLEKVWNPVEFFHRTIALELNKHGIEDIDQQEKFIQNKFIGRNVKGMETEITDGASITLRNLDLEEGQNFVYVFDWGDMWIFDVEVISTTGGINNRYKVMNETGELLPQYPEIDRETDDEYPDEIHNTIELEDFNELYNDNFGVIRDKLARKRGWLTRDETGFDKPAEWRKDIRCYRTILPGTTILVISFPYNSSYLNIIFKIDLLKTGLLNTIDIVDEPDNLFDRIEMGMRIVRIGRKEAVFLLRRGYYMAKVIGKKVSKTDRKWLEKFGVLKKSMTLSPFRCCICEVGKLDNDEVNEIKSLVKKEMKSGKLGTEDEEILDKICNRCHEILWH